MALNGAVATCLATNVGRLRSNNEDALAEDPEIGLLILADGMGGYNAGEVASQIATATILDIVRGAWSRVGGQPTASGFEGGAPAQLLKRAVETAHRQIQSTAQLRPECAGMGTTVVACLLHEDRFFAAHVGDSRLYRFRQGLLAQVTQDHSLFEEMVARGIYSRQDAARLVGRNIVTRALGVEAEVTVDLVEDSLRTGDVLMLCSDGLTDMVTDETLQAILGRYRDDLEAAANALIDAALGEGGRDNVSVALARIDSHMPAHSTTG